MSMKVVKVLWRDAYSIDAWKNLEKIDAEDNEGPIIETVGFLRKKTKKLIVLVMGFSDQGQAHSIFGIPMGMVKAIKYLK